ncbi:GAF domain-containing protein [Neisseria leonii]|uniref:GAF domain-containing protein n=1 Tax=Neisseria leonii TaxID=2995413 RepID=UPI00237AF13D|nr:GAF domain-containing protein [Neisseria sp. 3986]MDD9324955.1 GAF domain-containing protein [Neisseria sp. 3986]
MHELHISATGKTQQYAELLPQLAALLDGEPNLTANLANTAAVLKQTFGWLWVGFYLVEENELVLGPFQGPPACTRIAYGRGVCGQAWQQKTTLVVADVRVHPGHIACSPLSQSEIVVPIFDRYGHVFAVLDADAEQTAVFDEHDAAGLEQAAALISRLHNC